MSRRLLIDLDLIIYKQANSAETSYEFTPGEYIYTASIKPAQRMIQYKIDSLMDLTGAKSYVLAVSDSANFRKDLYPNYKGNRRYTRLPMLVKPLRDWAVLELGAIRWPRLEGDDVLGLYATTPSKYEDIIVTLDKDFRAVPCNLANLDAPKLITEITPEMAQRFHAYQTLAGDPTDGYPGCPGVGKVTAEKLLEAKGFSWDTIVEAYTKAKLTEEEALTQARLAFILQYGHYSPTTGEVHLWNPPIKK